MTQTIVIGIVVAFFACSLLLLYAMLVMVSEGDDWDEDYWEGRCSKCDRTSENAPSGSDAGGVANK